MAKGIGGTGEGFDAPSAGRLGGKGFGAHNVTRADLRAAMVKVLSCRPLVALCMITTCLARSYNAQSESSL